MDACWFVFFVFGFGGDLVLVLCVCVCVCARACECVGPRGNSFGPGGLGGEDGRRVGTWNINWSMLFHGGIWRNKKTFVNFVYLIFFLKNK